MNKIFIDDFYTKWADKEAINNILKFYQTTVFIPEFTESDKEENSLFNNYYEIPESIISYVHFKDLENNLMDIITSIENNFIDGKNNFVLPIITVFNSEVLTEGNYVIDFDNRRILCYKELVDEAKILYESKRKNIYCISYFVDLYRSTLVMKEKGFIEAIMKVGKIINNLELKLVELNIDSELVTEAQQVSTYNKGLNGREQLLIKSQYVWW